jgi:hypothetical protein
MCTKKTGRWREEFLENKWQNTNEKYPARN